MHYIPYTTVLLLCYTLACVASFKHFCDFDMNTIIKGLPVNVVVLEVSRQQNSSEGQAMTAISSNWDSIRFRYFTETFHMQGRYCADEGDTIIDVFNGETLHCTADDVLTPRRGNAILNVIIPGAIKLHVDRLRVQRINGTVIVPTFNGVCQHFLIPSDHRTVGVDNADMILYIVASVFLGTHFVWSLSCGVLETGRPVVGGLAISPKAAIDPTRSIRLVAHDICHLLGFNRLLPAMDSMVSNITGIRGRPRMYLFNGSNTVEKSSEHYNCSTLGGLEMDEGNFVSFPSLSHWKRRNAKDELMATEMEEGYYTALTMAAMEDTGFYKAIFENAEPMKWGRGAGCKFLDEKCLKDNVTLYPDMFCTDFNQPLSCTTDHRTLGKCDIRLHNRDLFDYYTYFTVPGVGGTYRSMDMCPFIEEGPNTGCRDGTQAAMPGSRISPQSRCVKARNLITKNGQRVGDVCVQIACGMSTLMLRYLGDDTWYNCPEGSTIVPKRSFSSGRILCPLRDDVCLGLEDYLPPPNPSTSMTRAPTTVPPWPSYLEPFTPNFWDPSDFDESDLSLSLSVLLPSVFLAVVIAVLTVS